MVIWNMLRPFGILDGHLEYVTAIWYMYFIAIGNLVAFWYVFPLLVNKIKESLASDPCVCS
jgi:hypothetical protein